MSRRAVPVSKRVVPTYEQVVQVQHQAPLVLFAELPELPESLNALYEPRKRGQKGVFFGLGKAGQLYHNIVTPILGQQWLFLARDLPRRMPYEFTVLMLVHKSRVFFEDDGDQRGRTMKSGEKHRMRPADTSNLVKLPEDVVSKVLGPDGDDRHYLHLHLFRHPIPEELQERLQIWITPLTLLPETASNQEIIGALPVPTSIGIERWIRQLGSTA